MTPTLNAPTRTLLVCVAVLIPTKGLAEDWPWFLGPRHDGTSSEVDLNFDWNQLQPATLWKQPIGTGYSAPSVSQDVIYLHDRDSRQERITARSSKDGSTILWTHQYPCVYRDPYGYNNGPRCTPTIAANHCYTLGPDGKLVCLQADTGSLKWKRDLSEDFDLPEWFFGMGCSPVYHDGLLIVIVGGQPDSGVVAFHADTGEIAWQNIGKSTWNGVTDSNSGQPYSWTGDEQVAGYSSPMIARIHGKPHLLCLMRQGLVSLNPATGKTYFRYWFRAKVHESVNAARPVVIGNQILLSASYRLGSVLLDVPLTQDSVDVVWETDELQSHWSTPIAIDGHLYGFSGRHENEAELKCLRLTDGKVMWSTAGFSGTTSGIRRDPASKRLVDSASGQFVPFPYFGRGSLTRVQDHLIILGERGTLAVAKVNPSKYTEVGRMDVPGIGYPSWTAPVISNGRLYLRSEDHLVCLDLKASKTQNDR